MISIFKNTYNFAEQLPEYEREGFLSPIPLLSVEEAKFYRGKLEELEGHLGGEVRRFDFSHLFFDWAYDLAMHPVLLDYMEQLIGPEIFLQSVRIFNKPVGDPSFVTWHQDGRHSNLKSSSAPTVWIALSHSTRESGCLKVVSGSHNMGILKHSENYVEENLLTEGDIAEIIIQEEKVRHIELRPGEMSIHHVNTLHSSLPNNSKDRRLGFSMTFISPVGEENSLRGIPARGKRQYPNLIHEFFKGRPTYSMEMGIAKHKELAKKMGLPLWRGLKLEK